MPIISYLFYLSGFIVLALTIRVAVVRRRVDSLFFKGLFVALLNFAIPSIMRFLSS